MPIKKYESHNEQNASNPICAGPIPGAFSSKTRILHLYHDLMNLYGDWANTSVLAMELQSRGREVVVDRKSVGDDINFSDYCLIHIGSGTERSLRACMNDISRFRDVFLAEIENGLHVLATGNSHELFGRTVTESGGIEYDTLCLLDFKTFHGDSRVNGDSICKASFLPEKLIGFINRASGGQSGEIERPFTVEMGPGSDDTSFTEGIRYKNVLGTYLTGPVLVRNPPLLRYLADLLTVDTLHTGDDIYGNGLFFSSQNAAYNMALRELEERQKRLSR